MTEFDDFARLTLAPAGWWLTVGIYWPHEDPADQLNARHQPFVGWEPDGDPLELDETGHLDIVEATDDEAGVAVIVWHPAAVDSTGAPMTMDRAAALAMARAKGSWQHENLCEEHHRLALLDEAQ